MVPWLRTAPMASLLASVVNMKGLVKSGYCSKGSVVSSVFKEMKASFVLSLQISGVFFFSSSVKGLAILLQLGINLL